MELESFLSFSVFTSEQIHSPNKHNFQEEFKEFWQANHAHQSTTLCLCERCIGKNPSETWSLQDAVAFQIGEWLDKRYSRSDFDIGLDPAFNFSSAALRQRQEILSTYASNDCLSMQRLLVSVTAQSSREHTTTSIEYDLEIHCESRARPRQATRTVIVETDSRKTPSNQIRHFSPHLETTHTASNQYGQSNDSSNGAKLQTKRTIIISEEYRRLRRSNRRR